MVANEQQEQFSKTSNALFAVVKHPAGPTQVFIVLE
jgi:hypothetical protein